MKKLFYFTLSIIFIFTLESKSFANIQVVNREKYSGLTSHYVQILSNPVKENKNKYNTNQIFSIFSKLKNKTEINSDFFTK